MTVVVAQEEKNIKQMINDWELVDHNVILSMMKECDTANERALNQGKGNLKKEAPIENCHFLKITKN